METWHKCEKNDFEPHGVDSTSAIVPCIRHAHSSSDVEHTCLQCAIVVGATSYKFVRPLPLIRLSAQFHTRKPHEPHRHNNTAFCEVTA